MLDRPPPSRLRVIEKGGRLVVIDTQTGQPPLTAAQQQGGKREFVPPASETRDLAPPPVMVSVSAPVTRVLPDRRPAAPAMLSPRLPPRSTSSNDRQARAMMLVVGGIVAVIFLIWTHLWIVVLVAMLIAPIRSVVLSAAKTAIKRFLGDAD
jgi:hypothetical protein